MRLVNAMRRDSGVYPGDGAVGRERPTWYSVGKLAVTSGRIRVTDLGALAPDNGIGARIPNGSYRVSTRLIDFAGSLCVSRVRLLPDGITATRGRRLGSVMVDLAAVVIADHAAMRKLLTEEEQEEFNDLSPDCKEGAATLAKLRFEKATVRFAICMSGFGDGTYPAYSLRSGAAGVGVEVEFIRDGHVLNQR